ncbi:MAG: peptidyl-prolyl cis-trans isomerase [Candidatus Cloacimonetes bacterium]|nr:peptidyl-prolyl cis-trans isomerase [Candidatus Cloacimonadota bacterium]
MKSLIFILLFLVLLPGCERKLEEREYLAKVNEETLSQEEFEASFSEDEWQEMSRKEKEQHLQEWVNLTALAQKCDMEKLSEVGVIRARINSAVKKIKANTVIANHLNNIKITEEELFNYYQLHKREYLKEIREYKYQRIVISDETAFRAAIEELKSEKKFKEVAKDYSETSEGSTGGYMGFASKGDMEAEVWNTLEGLEQYRWKSVQIADKYYLLRWYEKREASIEKNYAELKESLRTELLKEKQDDEYQEIMKDIELNFDIEIKYLTGGDTQ